MEIRGAIELACVFEVLARKPGNVHPGREFPDLSVADLLLSGLAIAPVLAETKSLGVGSAILAAVRAARTVAPTNANLGIVLLLAPLCAADAGEGPSLASIASVLEALTVEDARLAYAAIREASPGGIGRVEDQDVTQEPTVTLRQAMRLAADRDTIARQYANGFRDLFEVGVASLGAALGADCALEEAVVWCHLQWMAHYPDSLIARKSGDAVAEQSSQLARRLVAEIGVQPRDNPLAVPRPGFLDRPDVHALDAWLRADGNRRNPGTSADLVAASLYLALRTGRIDPAKDPWRIP